MNSFIIFIEIVFLFCKSFVASATISPCARWSTIGTTVAGTGIPGNSSNQLDGPEGIFIYKPLNRLYVADFNNHRIQLFSLNQSSHIGITVVSNVTLPSNIYVDDDGNAEPTIYAALYQANHVVKWVNGSSSSIPVGDECRSCSGIAVDKEKNVYMSEMSRQRVLKWSHETNITVTIAGQLDQPGTMNNQLHTPQGIYIDRTHGTLYVADSKNNRVQRWFKNAANGSTAAGSNTGVAANDSASFSDPISIIFDEETNILYVADFLNERIQRWLPNATIGDTIVQGIDRVNITNQFNKPTDLAFDNEGNLYVCDYFNNRVLMFDIDNRACNPSSSANSLMSRMAAIVMIIFSTFSWIIITIF